MKYSLDFAEVNWESPSNIALIKYWGKYGNQLPKNPSISFTLDNAVTNTKVKATQQPANKEIQLDFFFEGNANQAFASKIKIYLESIANDFPWLLQYRLEIHSSNTFPHSSGIASSASAFSALALCICSLHELISGEKAEDFMQKASHFARLGSGSACRSVYGGYTIWGESRFYPGSNNETAISIDSAIHPVFKTFKDTILLIEKGKKAVSSTKGHALLKDHPFAESRYAYANDNIGRLMGILKAGDLDGFVDLVEGEALMLHALMMSSPQSFILMKPDTLSVIEKIRDFRNQTGLHVLFTLDAGANVHVLNPEEDNAQIQDFVHNELIGYCQNQSYFCNSVGQGPKQIKK